MTQAKLPKPARPAPPMPKIKPLRDKHPEEKPSAASDRQEGGTHYKAMGVQPWDVVDTWPIEQRVGAYRSGALKYLMRMGSKDQSAQEIAKGKHYLEKLLEVLNENT